MNEEEKERGYSDDYNRDYKIAEIFSTINKRGEK
jgi:hypothetical protein